MVSHSRRSQTSRLPANENSVRNIMGTKQRWKYLYGVMPSPPRRIAGASKIIRLSPPHRRQKQNWNHRWLAGLQAVVL